MEVFSIITVLLIILLLIGVPISFSLMMAGIVGIFMQRGLAGTEFLFGAAPYTSTASFGLIIVPLFLFMGHMAFAAGISDRAFYVGRKWLGHVTGGLGMASIAACAAFATVCGSSIATAATVAKAAVPEMMRSGYTPRLATACAAAGGTLGVLIPPSGMLVIYAIVCNVSLPQLFAAAIVPGLLTAVAYAIAVYVTVKRDPQMHLATKLPREPWSERLASLKYFWEAAALFAIVMGTMFFGLATATEAAVLGAACSLLIAMRVKSGRGRVIWEGLVATGVTTSSIFLLLIGASLFGTAMATTQVPQAAAAWLGTLDLPLPIMIAVLLLPFIVLGCFIDGYSMILLLMPILIPVLRETGINPILFGILVTKTTEIGAITPPVGLNVFVVQNVVPSVPVGEIFKGASMFIVVELVLIALLIAMPQISLFIIP